MKIVKNANVILRDIHSTFFLINSKEKYWESRAVVKINEIGKIIWELLETSDDVNQIIKKLIEVYDINQVNFESVCNDVNTFLMGLQKIGYVIYE